MYARLSIVLCGLGLLVVAGCLSPVQQQTDALVCSRARIPIDAQPSLPPPPPPPEQLPAPKTKEQANADLAAPNLQQVSAMLAQEAKQEKAKYPSMLDRLRVPPGVPGSEAPGNPSIERIKKLPPAEQEKELAKYFPPMLPMGPDPQPIPGPDGRPITLEVLQRLARENSPLLREAAANIKAAEGVAWQAGMYPNPYFNLTSNVIGPNGGPLYGPGISQTIKTMGKIKLGQNAALVDLANAQLAYRRAETDLMASVRTGYYAVLTAEASIRANHALADLTEELYKIMIQQLMAGNVAAYEPMQVALFANQARLALIQSRTSYLGAWRQLASALGLPAMLPTALAGRLDQRLLRFDYEKCLARVLSRHTDVLTADNGIRKMRYNLRLNEVTWIPDVTIGGTVIYDNTPPGPPRWLTFVTGNMVIPIWDQNLGGIKQAQGQLFSAMEEPHRVRAALTYSVADAFNRLETNRIALEMYTKQMLRQQVNAFRATVAKHFGVAPEAGGPVLNDVIAAEQNLVSLIPMYLTALGAYWQAVSDMGSLLQTDNVFEMAAEVDDCPMPDLAKLLTLPCCHPCTELPQPTLKGISSFETPPGRSIAPEVHEVEAGPLPKPTTPATPAAPTTPTTPKQGDQAPVLNRAPAPVEPTFVQPAAAPALLLPPVAAPAGRN